MSVLLGLRINGIAVSSSTEFDGGWSNLIKNMFGKSPGKQLVGDRLRLSWLDTVFNVLLDNADEDQLIRYT